MTSMWRFKSKQTEDPIIGQGEQQVERGLPRMSAASCS
jgi:hypothetical protein